MTPLTIDVPRGWECAELELRLGWRWRLRALLSGVVVLRRVGAPRVDPRFKRKERPISTAGLVG